MPYQMFSNGPVLFSEYEYIENMPLSNSHISFRLLSLPGYWEVCFVHFVTYAAGLIAHIFEKTEPPIKELEDFVTHPYEYNNDV